MMDGDDDGNNDDDHDDEREKNSILDRVQFKEKSFQVLVQPLVYIFLKGVILESLLWIMRPVRPSTPSVPQIGTQ